MIKENFVVWKDGWWVLNYESQMAAMSVELKAKTDEFKERYNKGESLDSFMKHLR